MISGCKTWIEMSRNEIHGGEGWGFKECVWAPEKTRNGREWPFWNLIGKVKKGDLILHLKGKRDNASFIGVSKAISDGYLTNNGPTEPGEWNFSEYFYRADIGGFLEFSNPMPLKKFFLENNEFLVQYLENKRAGSIHSSVFFVFQYNHLQCLNGAYFSEIDNELFKLFEPLFIPLLDSDKKSADIITEKISTKAILRQNLKRSGQQEFSKQVKINYNNTCCFPGCGIKDNIFLVGAHIARWADREDLRGEISNGLCFCLMHDKAFEEGLFTIDDELKIQTNSEKLSRSTWGIDNLKDADGKIINKGKILPSYDALKEHRKRIKFNSD